MELPALVERLNVALERAHLPYDVGATAGDAAVVVRALQIPGVHGLRNLARDILVLRCSDGCLDRAMFESGA